MPSTGPSARLPAWKAALFALIPLVVVFGAAEGVLIAMDYPPKSAVVGPHGDNDYWIVEPNLKDSSFLHKELGTYFYVSTNDRSMRYHDTPVGRQDGVLRIMALGDSTTFGWGVNDADTYPQVLEGLLKGKAPGMDIQVINGGVMGYSTFQGLHHMRKRVMAYEPDIYLFGYIVQDARRSPISDRDQAISHRASELWEANPLYNWRTYLWMRNTYQKYRSARREDEAKDGETWRVPPTEYADNLKELAHLAQEADGMPVLFGFPLEVVGYTKAHREVMAEVAKAEGLKHFDPSQALFEASRKETLYFPKDRGHPNAAGCRVIARELASWLESSGALAEAAAHRK